MKAEKVSVSIPAKLLKFMEAYRTSRGYKSKSQVIEDALLSLQERELEAAYEEASRQETPTPDLAASNEAHE